MAKFILTLVLGLHVCFATAQPYWIRNCGSAASDEAMDISPDANGNSYTTGYFSASALFGTLTVNSSGVTDVFLTKTDANGQVLWVQKGGGPGPDRGLGVKADAQGNTVVTGYFYNSATFGTQTVNSSGLQDVFIAKYDNAGNLLWVQSAGGAAADIGNAVTFDNNGNVLITGEFSGTATFGSFTLTSMNGSVDVFTAKLDANGNFLWAKKGSAPQIDRGLDVGCDASGNVYVTGQFTDTITFDVTHFNNMYNAIFLIKYNSSGTEQWFRVIGGGTQGVANGLTVDANNNILLTGDFMGTLTFYSCPTNITLSNTYPSRIFAASYTAAGNLTWKYSAGSNDVVNARNICVDANNKPYIIGNFKCKFNEYADQYGQGTFNTVGFEDVFVTRLDASGAWQWSRQMGGKKSDNGNGVAAIPGGDAVICGSFNGHLGIPLSGGFSGYGYQVSSNVSHGSYCNDANYGSFGFFNTTGTYEVFIGRCIDPNRQPYDYYTRGNNGCNKDYVGVCINYGNNAMDNICGPDSVEACQYIYLEANTNTSSIGYNAWGSIGPDFTFLWSNGATTRSIYVTQSGYYSVTCTSADGCFVSQDTIYVQINPNPAVPLISDNVIVNTNAQNPDSIILCAPASAWLWGSGFNSGDSVFWSGPPNVLNDSILVTQSGLYCFYVYNSFGCSTRNCVPVEIDSLLPPILTGMTCLQDTDKNDSIRICQNSMFTMLVFDTLSNPNANLDCIAYSTIYWSVTPNTVNYMPYTGCFPYSTNNFFPTQTGWYTITATTVRKTACDTDTVIVTRSIYVDLSPLPSLTITGNTVICPGDSTLLVATGGTSYSWTFNYFPYSSNDSVWITQPGNYACTASNSYGCSAVSYVTVSFKPAPVVTMNPASGLICPNDSVQLTCTGPGTFQWYGPNGPFGGNNQSVYANTPGNYYCVLVDTTGCTLVSNTVTLIQYATPFLQATPDNIICPNDTVEVLVQTNPGSSVQWLPPLSGSALTEYITAAGTYSCTVISCGIPTTVSITIVLSAPTAQITAHDTLTFCLGDSVELSANAGNFTYNWNPYNYTSQNIFAYNTGMYILTVTDPYGCTASDSIVVNTFPNSLTAPAVVDTFVCMGKNATLNVSGMPVITWALSPNGTPFNFGNSYTTPPLNGSVTYYLQSQSGGCKSVIAPLNIMVDECPVTIPNVFTPNGDGVNDIFTFHSEGMQGLQCKIFNRWGNLIYEWDGITGGWNGTNMHNGEKVSDGVYYYIADIEDLGGTVHREHGFIQVLQN